MNRNDLTTKSGAYLLTDHNVTWMLEVFTQEELDAIGRVSLMMRIEQEGPIRRMVRKLRRAFHACRSKG